MKNLDIDSLGKFNIDKCDWDRKPDILQVHCLITLCKETYVFLIKHNRFYEGDVFRIMRNTVMDHPAHCFGFSMSTIVDMVLDIFLANDIVEHQYPFYVRNNKD